MEKSFKRLTLSSWRAESEPSSLLGILLTSAPKVGALMVALENLSPMCCAQSLSGVRLCDPMDCSQPGSSVHGISQARILVWVAILFSRGSSHPRIEHMSPGLQADYLPLSHLGSKVEIGIHPIPEPIIVP